MVLISEKSIDIMAERVRKVGGTTIRSISHIGQLHRTRRLDIVSAGEMIRVLMEDNGYIAKMISNAIDVCD
jgi:starvation-inducible DNA-binding protein